MVASPKTSTAKPVSSRRINYPCESDSEQSPCQTFDPQPPSHYAARTDSVARSAPAPDSLTAVRRPATAGTLSPRIDCSTFSTTSSGKWPTLSFGPGRSARIPTSRRAASLAARMSRTVFRCRSWSAVEASGYLVSP